MSLPSRNSDPARIVANTRTFFVTSATFGRRSLFQSNHACQLFLKVLFSYADQGKYRTHEFVLMKDHFHLLLSVEAGMTVEKAVQLLKGGFAYRASRELGFRSPVWQRGFSELRVRDAESYAAYKKYIQENPLRAGFVNKIEEYPFSSAAPGYELQTRRGG